MVLVTPAPTSSPTLSPISVPTSVTVTTYAGSTAIGYSDGLALSASFNSPFGLTVSSTGIVYVSDYLNNEIRMITGI